jgi:hypothetical protein
MFYNLGIATKCGKIRGCTMGKEDYRNKIIEIVNGIEDKNFLKFLHGMLVSFQKKWGI